MEPVDAPTVAGPRDLPALRRWLMRKYRPNGPFGFMKESTFISQVLPGAPLWWVEEGACDLLAESAPTIPDDVVLRHDELPAQEGLAVFATDIIGRDSYQPDNEVRVSAVAWGWSRLPDNMLSISLLMFARMDLADTEHPMYVLWEQLFPPEVRHGTIWAYLGRTDWVFGDRVTDVVVGNPHGDDPEANASMTEDRRLMMALWKLASTPVVRMLSHRLPRHMRRQAEREGVNPDVRVISLHGPTIGESPPTGEAGGTRHYRHRWVVRPHWVNQPYGPGRTQRRLILRGPFVKGPEDAPLIGGERVWRIQAPKPEERN
jgi:hypothetical protein